ncbi:MAG TPA: hypothetical protein VKL40_17865 [Candidatus Angelobacter sp.]|nr:hypothetical protein [Candidatus Angelobacter sp.]
MVGKPEEGPGSGGCVRQSSVLWKVFRGQIRSPAAETGNPTWRPAPNFRDKAAKSFAASKFQFSASLEVNGSTVICSF